MNTSYLAVPEGGAQPSPMLLVARDGWDLASALRADYSANPNAWRVVGLADGSGAIVLFDGPAMHRAALGRIAPRPGLALAWDAASTREDPAPRTVQRPSEVGNGIDTYGPELYFDPVGGEDWPEGCWACRVPQQDTYYGATPNDALAAWEAREDAPAPRALSAPGLFDLLRRIVDDIGPIGELETYPIRASLVVEARALVYPGDTDVPAAPSDDAGGTGQPAPVDADLQAFAELLEDFPWPAGVAVDALSGMGLILHGDASANDPESAAQLLARCKGVEDLALANGGYTFTYAGATIRVEFDEDGAGALALLDAPLPPEAAAVGPMRAATVTAAFLKGLGEARREVLYLPCYSDGRRRNGHGVPYFDRATVARLIAMGPGAGPAPVYRIPGEQVAVDGPPGIHMRVCDKATLDDGTTLWAVGAEDWPWDQPVLVPTADELAETMKRQVLEDMDALRVPRDVGSFDELGNYVDNNCYGDLCDDATFDRLAAAFGGRDKAGHMPTAMSELIDLAQRIVDHWLIGR